MGELDSARKAYDGTQQVGELAGAGYRPPGSAASSSGRDAASSEWAWLQPALPAAQLSLEGLEPPSVGCGLLGVGGWDLRLGNELIAGWMLLAHTTTAGRWNRRRRRRRQQQHGYHDDAAQVIDGCEGGGGG